MNIGSYLQNLSAMLGGGAPNAGASRIFISYRREDARGDAGRLTDDLKEQLGESQIFRDIETIEPGVDFIEAINRALGSCAVLLAIIGPHWLTVKDKDGRCRLDDPNDFIRLEIGAALERGVRVIPVLVGDVTMPKPEELPPDLEPLARRQAYELSDKRWEFDVAQLVGTLEKIPGIMRKTGKDKAPRADDKAPGRLWTRKRIAWTFAALVIGVTVGVVSEYDYESGSQPVPPLAPLGPAEPQTVGSLPPIAPTSSRPQNLPSTTFVPNPPASPRARQALSYSGFDALGRYPTVVQVYNPG